MSEPRTDWREVVTRNPRGLLILREEKRIVYGVVQKASIDPEGFVCIKLRWEVEGPADVPTLPSLDGLRVSHDEALSLRFPNHCTRFTIENTSYGPRVSFGANLLYINPLSEKSDMMIHKLRDAPTVAA